MIPIYRTIKTSLKSILGDKSIVPVLNNALERHHQIAIHAYLFIRLYTLHLYEDGKKLPIIDPDFIILIFKVIAGGGMGPPVGHKDPKRKLLFDELTIFYKDQFKPLTFNKLSSKNLSHSLSYLALEMATNYKNNIIMHFTSHLKKYINMIYPDAEKKDINHILYDLITKSRKKYTFLSDEKYHLWIKSKRLREFKKYRDEDHLMRRIKKQLPNESVEEITKIRDDMIYLDNHNTKHTKFKHRSDEKYHEWIRENRKKLLPVYKRETFYEDIKNRPFSYLKYLIYMNQQLGEKIEELEESKYFNHGIKLFQPLSLRTNLVIKNMTLDSTSLIDIFAKQEGNIEELYKGPNKNDFWKSLFPKLFRKRLTEKKYVFNNMIRTDGISVSLLMIHKDHIGRKNLKRKRKKSRDNPEFPFIDEVEPEKLEKAKKSILVGCDPGKKNILQFVDDHRNKLSYSYVQRRIETRAKKNKMIRDKLLEKDESEIGLKYYMDIMSSYNSKTCDYETFKRYIINKLYCNKELIKEYRKEIYRKLNWSKYTHTQRSEAKLVKKIKQTFTDKDQPEKEIVILYGNWNQTKQMRNFMSTPGIGIKRVIAKYFPLFTIDEYNTSKLSFCCEEETKKFMYRENPRNGGVELVHGLLSCQNCGKKWQRDVNGALSILYIGKYYIYEREIPEKYKRRQQHKRN